MNGPNDRSVAALRNALEEVDAKKPTLRLVAAIAHENGVTQTELADWFGVERKTIHNWLSRFDGTSPENSARDAGRPGRPSKLAPKQRRRLNEALDADPGTFGYGGSEWTPRLVADHVREAFGVTYSISSCRRLLREHDPAGGDDTSK